MYMYTVVVHDKFYNKFIIITCTCNNNYKKNIYFIVIKITIDVHVGSSIWSIDSSENLLSPSVGSEMAFSPATEWKAPIRKPSLPVSLSSPTNCIFLKNVPPQVSRQKLDIINIYTYMYTYTCTCTLQYRHYNYHLYIYTS